jgi:hypothetical protein
MTVPYHVSFVQVSEQIPHKGSVVGRTLSFVTKVDNRRSQCCVRFGEL